MKTYYKNLSDKHDQENGGQNNPYKTIIQGERGEGFRNFIVSFLKSGGLRNDMIERICDTEGMEMFNTVFTHPDADADNNYEYLEFLGDSVVNAAIVWYLNKRFPQLRTPQRVKIMARLKINLVSKKSFSEFAMKMDMWKYVTASEDVKNTKMKKTLEDVFEALFGAMCFLMDTKIREGTGYSIVYNIIGKLFDEIPISLKYTDLYDAKTRLKELFDFHKTILGKCIVESEKIEGTGTLVKIFVHTPTGFREQIGEGVAPLKQDAELFASKIAIQHLHNKNRLQQLD